MEVWRWEAESQKQEITLRLDGRRDPIGGSLLRMTVFELWVKSGTFGILRTRVAAVLHP